MVSVATTQIRQGHGQFAGLVWTLIRTDFKTRYHGTIGGFVWALLKPLTMFLVLLAVFSYVFASDPKYKLDLISGLNDGEITFYTQGKFTDLCRGPHIPDTGFIKALKLTNVAGAYWKGDEKNKMLTRVYGVSFPNQKELMELMRAVGFQNVDYRNLSGGIAALHWGIAL